MATFTGGFADELPDCARTPGTTAIESAAAQAATLRETRKAMLRDILKRTPAGACVPADDAIELCRER